MGNRNTFKYTVCEEQWHNNNNNNNKHSRVHSDTMEKNNIQIVTHKFNTIKKKTIELYSEEKTRQNTSSQNYEWILTVYQDASKIGLYVQEGFFSSVV